MLRVVRNFCANEDGATAIEYALIAFIVALGIITGIEQIPPALDAIWTDVVSYMGQ